MGGNKKCGFHCNFAPLLYSRQALQSFRHSETPFHNWFITTAFCTISQKRMRMAWNSNSREETLRYCILCTKLWTSIRGVVVLYLNFPLSIYIDRLRTFDLMERSVETSRGTPFLCFAYPPWEQTHNNASHPYVISSSFSHNLNYQQQQLHFFTIVFYSTTCVQLLETF